MLKKNDIVTIRIDDISKDGEGIGKADGFALFVKDTVPGDLIEASVMKVKKRYGYARLLRVLEPSTDRTEPACPVARQCGGCRLQMMTYEKQLQLKQHIVINTLEHIGGFTVVPKEKADFPEKTLKTVPMQPIVPVDPVFRYRNKAVIPVGTNKDGKPVAGFFAGHTHAIIPCDDCLLGPEENGSIIRCILYWMVKQNIPAYNEADGTGLIRHIFLRKSRESGRFQLCLIVNGKKVPGVQSLREALDRLHAKGEDGASFTVSEPLICGACFSANTRRTNVIFGDAPVTLWGDPILEDSLYSDRFGITVRYRISPMSFYQVNPNIAEKMYEEVLALADLTGRETVFDLYCGTGTISLFLAKKAKEVIGVEIVPEAVANAMENARLNGCSNARFLEGKAEEVIPELIRKENLHADVVVVDPPRKGCAGSLLRTIIDMNPDKIVYVSCDPATLARDLKILCAEQYRIESVRPYDQFAMSMHVETVVSLGRKKEEIEYAYLPYEGSKDLRMPIKVSYLEIKDWVKQKYGFNVTSLMVAQTKRKHGLIERENYNKPKDEGRGAYPCPKDKEAAIEDAFRYFGMIS